MSNRGQRAMLVVLVLLGLVVLAAAPASGACTRPDTRDVAELEVRDTALVFHPLEEYQSMTLRVTGPYRYAFEVRVKTGERAVFELDEDADDGCYTYELRTAPILSREILEILARARATGDLRAVRQLWRDGKLPEYARTQAGGFEVVGRVIVVGGEPEKQAKAADAVRGGSQSLFDFPMKDYVINDDLIVDGSACVGFDCFNGFDFSFTTIAMSENNLRIKFDDTSTLASYPRNDWWLVANDSTNGGANRFSIEDCGEDAGGYCNDSLVPFTIEATAPSHSIHVEDYGRIGFGTAVPYVELHAVDGDTPTVRLDQDGSSGWAAQAWDVAGNETNFFIRDVTSGSKLPFRIQPGAPTNSIYVAADGDVGFGTSTPAVDFHIDRGTSQPANFRITGDSAGYDLEDKNGTANRKVAQQYVDAGLWRLRGLNDAFTAETVTGIALDLSNGRVGIGNASSLGYPLVVGTDATNGNGAHVTNGGVWTNGSSRESKEDVAALGADDAMAALVGLEPVRFHYKGEPGEEYVGFIAEDVPELVATASRKHLSPMDIVAVLTKVVQEQQRTIEALAARVDELEGGGRR